MNQNAADKIKMMQASMRCFAFGSLGLLPVIGFPFAIAALWLSGRARSQEKQFWNPAKVYRVWGTVSAAVGAVCWFAVIALIAYNVAINYVHGGGSGNYGGWSSNGGD